MTLAFEIISELVTADEEVTKNNHGSFDSAALRSQEGTFELG